MFACRVATLCGHVGRYQLLGGTVYLHLQGWRHYVPPESWYLRISPHGVTIQRTDVDTTSVLESGTHIHLKGCVVLFSEAGLETKIR
jgi:hypothetical protein